MDVIFPVTLAAAAAAIVAFKLVEFAAGLSMGAKFEKIGFGKTYSAKEKFEFAQSAVVLLAVLAVGVAFYLQITGDSDRSPSCVAKWKAYFQEAGSYPTLSDGRNATDVAFERCARGGKPF